MMGFCYDGVYEYMKETRRVFVVLCLNYERLWNGRLWGFYLRLRLEHEYDLSINCSYNSSYIYVLDICHNSY